MSKQYGSKQVGWLIVGGGAVLLTGMIACNQLIPHIDRSYVTEAVRYVPFLFMVLSAPVAGFGFYLIKHKRVRPKKEYF